jgi:hypothetical protein
MQTRHLPYPVIVIERCEGGLLLGVATDRDTLRHMLHDAFRPPDEPVTLDLEAVVIDETGPAPGPG